MKFINKIIIINLFYQTSEMFQVKLSLTKSSISLMLYTSSEANFIKLKAVPNNEVIKTLKLSVIKSIDVDQATGNLL